MERKNAKGYQNMKKVASMLTVILVLVITVTTASAGWVESNGRWWYEYNDGTWPASRWMTENGVKYYFDSAGWMVTGWKYINNAWYYFDKSGAMRTGWIKDGDWYLLDKNGIMLTGWQLVDGKWYYMNSSGAMKTGWLRQGGTYYYLTSSGAMATGWQLIGGKWYYFEGSGAMKTGWIQSSGSWYFLNSNGAMATGWVRDGGKRYYMTPNGNMVTGWKEIGGTWYYFDGSGAMASGWVKISGVWHLFEDNGEFVKTGPLIGSNTNVDLTEQKGINNDFIAWIKIPGTNIDYPVVHSDNVEWYLTHTFTGQQSKLGTLFSLGKCKWRNPSQNIVIYGHHVEGEGYKMFKELLKYKDYSFFKAHPTIYMDSMYQNARYKIFAVFDMTEGDLDPAKTSFGSDREFMSFVNYAKSRSFYSTGVEVTEKDKIVTLVTCDRYFKLGVGRLIVMAVQE